MIEIMPVPRNLILLSYQQGASVLLFLCAKYKSLAVQRIKCCNTIKRWTYKKVRNKDQK